MRFQRVGALEELLSRILIVGVLASTAVIALGLALLIPAGTGKSLLLAQLLSHHATIVAGLPTSLAAVLNGVVRGQSVAVIDLGVLLLILTPVLRVALAAVFFALHGDLRYTLISGVVLVLLILGFILGSGSHPGSAKSFSGPRSTRNDVLSTVAANITTAAATEDRLDVVSTIMIRHH